MNKIHKWNGRQQFDFIRNILKIGHFSIWITLYLTENVIKWLTIDVFRKKWTDWCLILHEMQHVLQQQKEFPISKKKTLFFSQKKKKLSYLHKRFFFCFNDHWWPFINLSEGIIIELYVMSQLVNNIGAKKIKWIWTESLRKWIWSTFLQTLIQIFFYLLRLKKGNLKKTLWEEGRRRR